MRSISIIIIIIIHERFGREMSARPIIPKKLPPSARRPLSLIQDNVGETNANKKPDPVDETVSEYAGDYAAPIEQPSLPCEPTSDLASHVGLDFFNEYAYELSPEANSSENVLPNDDKVDLDEQKEEECVYQLLSDAISDAKQASVIAESPQKSDQLVCGESLPQSSTPSKEPDVGDSITSRPYRPSGRRLTRRLA